MGAGASSKQASLCSLEQVDSMIAAEFKSALVSKLVLNLSEQRQELASEAAIKDEVKRMVHEYVIFLWLRKLYPQQIMPASKPVDIVWQQHILFTREYEAFCQHQLGKFLHYTPNSSEQNGYDHKYSKLLIRYKYHAKSEPPEEFWPQSAAQKQRRSTLEKQKIELNSKIKFLDDEGTKVSKSSNNNRPRKSVAKSSFSAGSGADYAAIL